MVEFPPNNTTAIIITSNRDRLRAVFGTISNPEKIIAFSDILSFVNFGDVPASPIVPVFRRLTGQPFSPGQCRPCAIAEIIILAADNVIISFFHYFYLLNFRLISLSICYQINAYFAIVIFNKSLKVF